MTTNKHEHCDYCGRDMGSTDAYSFEKDKNDNYWCGKCHEPDYAVIDHDLDGVGQNRVGFKERPGFWREDEVDLHIETWQEKDYWEGKTVDKGE